MTFANLLGCALVPCVLEAECSEFQLNQLHPVGISSAESPPEFVLHVIALERKGKSGHADDLVYDAVLRIDQDPHPSCQPARFIIVDGIPLGTPTTPTGTGSYFPQLIAAGSIHRCRARTIGRPWVGAQPCQECVRRCPLTRYVRYLWALQSAKRPTGMFSASRTLRINGYDGREIYSGRPGVPRSRLPRHPLASRIDFVSQDPDVGRAVRVDWWTDDDPWITLSFMAELLAMSEIPVEPVAIRGGPAYTVPRRTSLLVLNEGAVIRFSSAGARRVDMVDLCDTAVSVL
jgi:hypothetical protein